MESTKVPKKDAKEREKTEKFSKVTDRISPGEKHVKKDKKEKADKEQKKEEARQKIKTCAN